MTVSSTAAYSGPYTGNGATVAFPFSFKALATDEIEVLVNGAVVTSGFTVALNAGGNGGTVTFATAPTTGAEIFIRSDPDFLQDISFTNAGAFLPESHDEALDRAATRDIMLLDRTERAIRMPLGVDGFDLPDASAVVLQSGAFPSGAAGGNVESIGLKATVSLPGIPSGTERVRTSGYSAVGKGAADYVYDAAVDAAYVLANARTSFLAADGRGFRLSLDQTVTPFMFGTVGDLIADDTTPYQAFLDFIDANRCEAVNLGARIRATREMVHGGTFGGNEFETNTTFVHQGSLFILVTSNINGAVLRVRTNRGATSGPINITSDDFYANYAGRLFDYGVVVEDRASRQVFSFVGVDFARISGLHFSTNNVPNRLSGGTVDTAYSNTFATHVENSMFYGCGSGSLNSGSFLTANFSDKANSGTSGGFDQRSTMTVTTLPSALVESSGLPISVRIAGELYELKSINRTAGTISVYPWVDLVNTGATGTLEYIYGGGITMQGGDANKISGKVAATNCSAGIVNAAAYNGHFDGTFQFCLIGTTVGSGTDNVALGGSLFGYFEGCTYDALWNTFNVSNNAYYAILSQQGFDAAKIKRFMPRFSGNNYRITPLLGLIVSTPSGWLRFQNIRDIDGAWSTTDIAFDQAAGETVALHFDNPTINILPPANNALIDIWGYRARTVAITGTGGNRQPTGTLTITPGGVTKKINGGVAGANATFAGFTAPVTVQVALDPADANNFIVSFLGGRVERAAAQANSAAADVATVVTDFNALLAKLRAAGVISA